MSTRYAIVLAYDGTDFCGWQIQRGTGLHTNPKPSVEGTVAGAIAEFFGEPVTVVASGRTDAGVHASGQVAHFSLDAPHGDETRFPDALNRLLPPSIRVLRLGRVPKTFRANRSVQKQYSYYFQQGPAPLPHLRSYTFWNRYPLNHEAMATAVRDLCGEHDFAAFCAAGAQVSSTVRTIFDAEVSRVPIPLPGVVSPTDASLIRLRLNGSGFLKQMVRILAGTLKQIGEGRRPVDDLATILRSGDRQEAGPTLPPDGLWLDRVWYFPEEEVGSLQEPNNASGGDGFFTW